ncbi:hypothetical protein BC332_30148 [Capsicum chinense]|nr:hypothetical protein BC332_30148 [Capsicum chinense]
MYGVEHAIGSYKKISSKIIDSLCINYFLDGKGPSIREIQKIVIREMHYNASYLMYWKGSVIAKNIVHGTTKHLYAYLPSFSHMVELLNPDSSYSIMVNKMDGSFVYYFLAFGACIWRYAHMIKAYSFNEFSEHFVELKNKCPEVAYVLENVLGFEKWSKAHFSGNRERYALVCSSNNKFFPCAEKTLRDNKSESNYLYVINVNKDLVQFTMFDNGVAAKVNILERGCSCRKYYLVKLACEHAMAYLQEKYGNGEGYGNSIYEYSLPIYKTETYLLVYSEVINVVPLESEWIVP